MTEATSTIQTFILVERSKGYISSSILFGYCILLGHYGYKSCLNTTHGLKCLTKINCL